MKRTMVAATAAVLAVLSWDPQPVMAQSGSDNTQKAQEAPNAQVEKSTTPSPVKPDENQAGSMADKKENNPPAQATVAQPPAKPVVTLTAKVDLTNQRLTVIEHGVTKHTWVISSGAKGFETPRGTFQPQWMAKDWYSRKYDNAPMPHSVFFKDGVAIHATMNPATLGTAASHGCVRLTKANAATFYAMVQRHGMKHTRIHVFGTPRHAPDLVASAARVPRQAMQAGAGSPFQQPPRQARMTEPGNYAYTVARPAPIPAALVYPGDPIYRPLPPMRVVNHAPSRRY